MDQDTIGMEIKCIFICLGGSFLLIAFIALIAWIGYACYRSEKRKKKASQKQRKIKSTASSEKKDVATNTIVTRRGNEGTRRKHDCCHSTRCCKTLSNVKIEQEKGPQEGIANPPKRPRNITSLASNSQPEIYPTISDKCLTSPSPKKAKSNANFDNNDIGEQAVQRSIGLHSTSGYVCMKGGRPSIPKNKDNFSQKTDTLDEHGYLMAKTTNYPPNSSISPTFENASRNIRFGIQHKSLEDIPKEEFPSQESLYDDCNTVCEPPNSARSPTSVAPNSQPGVHPKATEKLVNSSSLNRVKSRARLDENNIGEPAKQHFAGFDSTSGYVCMPINMSSNKLDKGARRFNFDQSTDIVHADGHLTAKKARSSPNSPLSPTSGIASLQNKRFGIQKGSLKNIPEDLSSSQESL